MMVVISKLASTQWRRREKRCSCTYPFFACIILLALCQQTNEQREIFVHESKSIEKEKRREFVYLFFYLFCPGGAEPDGFTFVVVVCCVNPEPEHDGCCPPG
jgi:hypothetical protein